MLRSLRSLAMTARFICGCGLRPGTAAGRIDRRPPFPIGKGDRGLGQKGDRGLGYDGTTPLTAHATPASYSRNTAAPVPSVPENKLTIRARPY